MNAIDDTKAGGSVVSLFDLVGCEAPTEHRDEGDGAAAAGPKVISGLAALAALVERVEGTGGAGREPEGKPDFLVAAGRPKAEAVDEDEEAPEAPAVSSAVAKARSVLARSRARALGETGPGGGDGPALDEPAGVVEVDGYVSRPLAGTTDLGLLATARSAGMHVILSGPPGTGKTALALAHAKACGTRAYVVAGHADCETADFVGMWVPRPGGEFAWRDGPLVLAMREGAVLFVDDATLIPPGVAARLYPAMDGQRRIVVHEHEGEEVAASPGFQVIAAHNPGAPGAVLSEALASRFAVQVVVRSDYSLAVRLGVPKAVAAAARHLSQAMEAGELSWAPQMRELLAYRDLARVAGARVAAANLVTSAPEDCRGALVEQFRVLLPDIGMLVLEER